MPLVRSAVHPFRLALRSPFVTGTVSVRYRAGFLVSLTSEGHTGWGEASPLPGWSRNTLLQTESALRPALQAIDSGREGAVEAAIESLTQAPHARAAVAGAWADLRARRAGLPLARCLVADRDAAPASEVAVNALVTASEPSGVAQAVRDALAEGFGVVKLKVGGAEPTVDIERVRAARAALGSGPELRLDANGAWDEDTALGVLAGVQGCDIAFCEEPVAGIEAIASLGRRSPVPVAVDESVRAEVDAVQALALGVRTIVVKPQALGGPDVAMSITARCREAGASAVVTSFLDSAVGLAHALHVAAASDAASPGCAAHGLATAGLLGEDVAVPPPVVAATMSLPPSPGLGVAPALGFGRLTP